MGNQGSKATIPQNLWDKIVIGKTEIKYAGDATVTGIIVKKKERRKIKVELNSNGKREYHQLGLADVLYVWDEDVNSWSPEIAFEWMKSLIDHSAKRDHFLKNLESIQGMELTGEQLLSLTEETFEKELRDQLKLPLAVRTNLIKGKQNLVSVQNSEPSIPDSGTIMQQGVYQDFGKVNERNAMQNQKQPEPTFSNYADIRQDIEPERKISVSSDEVLHSVKANTNNAPQMNVGAYVDFGQEEKVQVSDSENEQLENSEETLQGEKPLEKQDPEDSDDDINLDDFNMQEEELPSLNDQQSLASANYQNINDYKEMLSEKKEYNEINENDYEEEQQESKTSNQKFKEGDTVEILSQTENTWVEARVDKYENGVYTVSYKDRCKNVKEDSKIIRKPHGRKKKINKKMYEKSDLDNLISRIKEHKGYHKGHKGVIKGNNLESIIKDLELIEDENQTRELCKLLFFEKYLLPYKEQKSYISKERYKINEEKTEDELRNTLKSERKDWGENKELECKYAIGTDAPKWTPCKIKKLYRTRKLIKVEVEQGYKPPENPHFDLYADSLRVRSIPPRSRWGKDLKVEIYSGTKQEWVRGKIVQFYKDYVQIEWQDGSKDSLFRKWLEKDSIKIRTYL